MSVASPGNIVSVPPQDPAELTTPAPVVHSGAPPQDPAEQVMPTVTVTVARERGGITMGVGEPVTFVNDDGEPVTFVNALSEPVPASPPYVEPSRPPDEFAEAAAEMWRNPDPAVEREIFEYGVKEIEPPEAGQPRKSRRLRSAVGRSVRANNVTIILSVASLVLLIDEKIASLRDERRNDQDALAEVIAHYEGLRRDLEALRDVAIEVRQGTADDKTVTKATGTFSDCVRKWWNKRHDEICTKACDASLFVSCVGLCSLVGCGGATAVAVSGALIGGKPVVDALKALPKRLLKDHDQ
jgi:hypothetical protein